MSSSQDWDESFDFVIVGSGGASMCAALAAKACDLRSLIIEKQAKVGGSTGFSGGVWWIPDNPVMKRAGVQDSYERARQYFDSVVTYHGPGSSDARRLPRGAVVRYQRARGVEEPPVDVSGSAAADGIAGLSNIVPGQA